MKLTDTVRYLPGVGPKYSSLLERLEIYTIKDFINHFPKRYIDTTHISNLKDGVDGLAKTFIVTLDSIFPKKTRFGKSILIGSISDESLKAKVIWFNQEYLLRSLNKGDKLIIYGKIIFKNSVYTLNIIEFEKYSDESVLGKIVPIYPSTKGLNQKWFRNRMHLIVQNITTLGINKYDLNLDILKRENLEELELSYTNIHLPTNFELLKSSKERLAFEEMFEVIKRVEEIKKKKEVFSAYLIDLTKLKFKPKLNFELTNDQKNSIKDILLDLSRETPMNRLLMGDVGSGKTAVAVIASLSVLANGYDVVFLCPTSVLANQHFNTTNAILKNSGFNCEKISRKGEIKKTKQPTIYITTHAIFYKSNSLFTNLGLLIIDEQHKFGVEQREQIFKLVKGKKPHTLMMSATPIPRTIAETFFSDLAVSVIKEKPNKGKDVNTYIVPTEKKKDSIKWIENHLRVGEQVYVVCPVIEQGVSELRNVKEEFESYKKEFSKYRVAMLHGKMKEDEKNKILQDFKNKKINVLVSTQIIEVGIDNPNATIMIIESAERFGLAQLHQLRGRVGRGNNQSFCFLFLTKKSIEKDNSNLFEENNEKEEYSKAIERLNYFSKHYDGFEIAEFDLKQRGPGEVYGNLQSGIPKFKLANILDYDLINKCKRIYLELNQ